MKKNTKNRMVPALARGLNVLELLAKEESELTLRSISERLGIPTPSLWRILRVLRDNGYVLLDPDKKTYRLGFKFLYLGNILLNEMGFRSGARAYLKQLVDLTGETAELSARVKDQLILIDQVEGPEDIDPAWFADAPTIGVTAGASTPEFLVQEVVEYCQRLGAETIAALTVVDEDVKFLLPSELTVLQPGT